jgi:hypothetical protein
LESSEEDDRNTAQTTKPKSEMERVPNVPDNANPVHAKSKFIVPDIILKRTLKFIKTKIVSIKLPLGDTAGSNIGNILEDMPMIMIVINPNPTT